MNSRRDPVDLAATAAINIAAGNGGQVTGASVAEGLKILRMNPGSDIYEATTGATYENTRARIVELLEDSGRDAMIGPKLRESRPTNRPLKAGDRIRLAFPISSGGVAYPEGSKGQIERPSDPSSASVRALTARDEHPVKFDRDDEGLVAVSSGYLIHE